MSPGFLPQKLAQARQQYGFTENEVVSDEGRASVYTRLNVYSSGYLLRLLDCMYADYAISKKFMGDDVFDSFARSYLLYFPSKSFTLYDLGRSFPDFLAKTKPPIEAGGDPAFCDFMDLPIALATIERARREAMRALGTEDDLLGEEISIQDILLNTVKISLPACLHLLELQYPMRRFFEAIQHDKTYELPSPQKSYMAVSRKNFRVVMVDLTEMQYLLLSACQTNSDLYNATSMVATACNVPAASILADAYLWLPDFQRNGLINWA